MRFFLSLLLLMISMALYAIKPLETQDDVRFLHLEWLDKSIDPAKDFYSYANGGWQKTHPIPAAYSSWDHFSVLSISNQKLIKKILETSAYHSHLAKGSIQQKIGDFYFSGMDEKTINRLGVKPLLPEFKRIENVKSLNDLQNEIAHLQWMGADPIFEFGQMQDFVNSDQVIGVASQGGLSLPDKDYYLKSDKKFQDIRQAYLHHVTNMFKLIGDADSIAQNEANTVLKIETDFAKASLSRVEMRDPRTIYHPTTLAELEKLTPNFSWNTYFKNLNHPEIKNINLATPLFFKNLNTELTQVSIPEWKIYLRWHLLNSFAGALSQPFVDEEFRMSATLNGAKKLLPRWQRVISAEEGALGFAIGKIYVEKYFPASSKHKVEEMIHNIRQELLADLHQLNWMSPATRDAAIIKLSLMSDRVGYPDKWRDYSTLSISRNSYIDNIFHTNEFMFKRELNKIGKPVDKTEWDMTPQTINAYYDTSMNQLNIPAGILQPPFFDPKAPDAINYGGIGFVIGHEMTHGFDDEGSQFDGHGNLHNWWTKEDSQKFHATTDKIANQFSHFTVNGNLHVQGKLVLGEATADLGGLTLAYRALHHSLHNMQPKTIAGYSLDQQFFLSAAHVWANNIRSEELTRHVLTDPHPPAICRVNGTFANMPQFRFAYHLKNNSEMIAIDPPVIW